MPEANKVQELLDWSALRGQILSMNFFSHLEEVRTGLKRGTAPQVAQLLGFSLSFVRHRSLDPAAQGVIRQGRSVRFDFPVFDQWLAEQEKTGLGPDKKFNRGGSIVAEAPPKP